MDGNGKFEFEEFRDFYLKFIDSLDSRDLLKRFAQHRFRDQEKEKLMAELFEADKAQKDRAKALRYELDRQL